MKIRASVKCLSGSRAVAEGFTTTRRTRGDKKMEVALHLAAKPRAADWVSKTLTIIANAKAGDGKAIQILCVSQQEWDKNAGVAPEALKAARRFVASRPGVTIKSIDRSIGLVKLAMTVADVRAAFGADIHNIEKTQAASVVKSTQRVGGLTLPKVLQGHVIGVHMSIIPKEPNFRVLDTSGEQPRAGDRFTGYTPVDARVHYKGVGAKIGVAVSFGPNGTADDIASQIVEAVRRGYKFTSWSWGNPSSRIDSASRAVNERAINYATALGCLVAFASGDEGANDGASSPDVDHPAEFTWSVMWGGTGWYDGLTGTDRYWNDDPNRSAAGYGVSKHYKAPYQGGGFRRGPDISGNASPKTGFKVFGLGQSFIFGGTSDVPYCVKEIAKVSASLGIPLGAPHPWLYKYAQQHSLVTPVLTSDGQVDVRCGLGTPVFENWLNSLKQLVEAGRNLKVPAGFQLASFGSVGPAMHIGELGGGFRQSELDTYCDMIGVPHIKVVVWGVNGGRNDPDAPGGMKTGPSGEVYLDVDVVADAGDARSGREVK